MRRQPRGLWLLLCLLAVLSACSAPSQGAVPTKFPASATQVSPTQLPTQGPQPAISERRQIVLEWPSRLREKDSDYIILSLLVDEQGNATATAEIAGHVTEQQTVEIPNLYDTHNVVATARLDLPGLDAWREEMREPLRPGQPVNFRWSIRADEAGVYRGVAWLSLEFVPLDGGAVEQMTLLSRPISVDVVTILGMPGWLARLAGGAGLVISTVLGFPFAQTLFERIVIRRKPRGRSSAAVRK